MNTKKKQNYQPPQLEPHPDFRALVGQIGSFPVKKTMLLEPSETKEA